MEPAAFYIIESGQCQTLGTLGSGSLIFIFEPHLNPISNSESPAGPRRALRCTACAR